MSLKPLVHTCWTARLLSIGGIACALAVTACGDDDDDACEPEPAEHSHDTCGLQENCTDTVDLEEGLRVESEDGAFTVEVVSHRPLSVEDNEIIVAIENADGDPVTDAELEVDVFSVDCMHPGPRAPAMVSANEDGNYELAPVHAHGGPWDTVIAIEAGGESDTARLHFCVPGEEHADAGVVHEHEEEEPHCH